MLSNKEEKRYNALYEQARALYCEKTDFDPCEWLNPKEAEEYNNLTKKDQGE